MYMVQLNILNLKMHQFEYNYCYHMYTYIINMFENKVKKSSQRISTSKVQTFLQAQSTSRQKQTKKQLIQVIYTDTTGLKTHKSKSQHQSKQRISSHKSIQLKKINKPQSLQKNNSKIKNQKDLLFDRKSDNKNKKGIFYDNVVTEKAVQLKWNKKVSIFNKNQAKSMEKGKKQWDQSKIPYNWQTVLLDYHHLLTKYQQNQIKQYKKIYYIGHKAKKREKIDTTQANFDNQQKQYNFLLNDHIAYRFQILGLIGKGSYGQVFRIFDHKKKQQLALKMIKNRTKFSKQAFIQIQILTHIKEKDPQGTSNIIKIKDFVIFRKHVCLIFQIMSQNLYQLIIRNNYNGINLDLIRRFSIQILTAAEFLRKNKIIHCDLKPENILLKQYHKSGIKIIDFGSSCFESQTIYTYIQSRYYRAPQITLGIDYDTRIDIWSIGCILGELYTGVPLFPGQNQSEQIKYLVNTIGLPSDVIINRGSRSNLFFQKGALKSQLQALKTIEYFSKNLIQRIPDSNFRQFLQQFLKWDAKQRITPMDALKSKWILQGIPQHLRGSQLFNKDEQKQISSRTVRISKSKSKSRDKKSKLSLASINTKKTLQYRQ